MNITIVGPGAIGSLWVYCLARVGHHVAVWQKEPQTSTYHLALDNRPVIRFRANDIADLNKTDLLIVTVKAWQVETALSSVLQHVLPDTPVLLMHNGMGAIEALTGKIDNHPVVLATTTHGAYKAAPSKVEHTGVGSTVIGGYNQAGNQCQFLCEVLDHALPTVNWSHSINTALWHKLAVNCVINPLTALHQCPNGDLLNSEYRNVIEQIINEVHTVMLAEGIDISKVTLQQTVQSVISATARNYSSMQQDIANQRTTEIEFINGYLIRKAQQHGIHVPANIELYTQLRNTATVIKSGK